MPAGTLIAAVVGVVIGGLINRATLTNLDDKRLEKEDAREASRSLREVDLFRARAKHELEGERRRALGSMRVLASALERAAILLEAEGPLDHASPLSPKGMDARLQIRPEDLHNVAMWLPSGKWSVLALRLEMLHSVNARRSATRENWSNPDEVPEDLSAEGRTDLANYLEMSRQTAEHLREANAELVTFMSEFDEAPEPEP